MEFRKEIGESLTLKFAEAANRRKRQGKEIISLGLGEPDFDTPPALIEATINILKTRKSCYSSPMGLPELREKLSAKLQLENNIPANAKNILVTPGAKQAFQLALMALLEPGDEVIVLNPSFVSFIPQIYIAEPRSQVKVVDVNKDNFSISLPEIEKQITPSTKLIIINSPNNPAGYVINIDEMKELFRLAEEHNLFILSDEIYEKLVFSPSETLSIGSLENEVSRVLTVNGFSKSHAITGWRLGYLCFPDVLFSKLLKLQQHINTNTCTFIQEAMTEAFNMDMGYLDDYNKKLAQRCKLVTRTIESTPGLSLVPPNAGFFAFVNISELGIDSNTFCSRLVEETGVATTPGIAFGINWDDHFRLSFAVSEKILKTGMESISSFVTQIA